LTLQKGDVMKILSNLGCRKCLSGSAILMYCLVLLTTCCGAEDGVYFQIQDVRGKTEDSPRGGISRSTIQSYNDYTEILTSKDGKAFSKSRVSGDLILSRDPYKVCIIYTPHNVDTARTTISVDVTILNLGVKDENIRPPWTTFQPPYIIDNGNILHTSLRLEFEKEELIPVGYIGDTGNYLSLAVKVSKEPINPPRKHHYR
jgi:hypothetical protein